MTIDQVIAAQEANEQAYHRCTIDRATFKAQESVLAKAYSAAMVGIMKRIAARTIGA